ncbi:amidase [Vibrio cincinnatiensis]|uniref:amidase n=1 Tax=Vibrio cincinnatiensis TaxID=675 RepID=UPI0013024A27|nr:amidase [Vibrio cincinnatiensis]MCG3722959.1 amidase [Vibrio cincinnatiensis]MCG3767544.1 amidase [Vibrio cincinnatiensis]
MSKDTRIYCSQGPDTLPAMAQGTLSGTRFVFKDLFDVKGYATGAGNPIWLKSHELATATSPLITALLRQGAECVGRVQTDELAYSLNGQNVHYGTPINPRATECIPGGSSSGSAVAVAAGDCDFSIGTDTGGSVRVPASYCGLFGLRPTLGALDLSHCFELAKSFDTAGIFTRDLRLMRDVWSVLAARSQFGERVTRVYLDAQCQTVMSSARFERFTQQCQGAGIEIVQSHFLAESGWQLAELSLLFRTIQGFEIIVHHDAWLTLYGDSLDPAIWERVQWARTITYEQYQHAKAQQQDFQQQLLTHLKQQHCLWAIPTAPSGPPSLMMPADELAAYRSQLVGLTSIAGLSGLPQLHLPMEALLEGPCGISLMGLPHQEETLLVTGEAVYSGQC